MLAFLEVALRLQNAQILPLDSWKAVPAPDAAARAVIIISNHQYGCTGPVAISVAHFLT